MEIDRKMARYLLEIKRSLPRARQHEFNISSPNIKNIVLNLHGTTTNSKTKGLASAFLEQLGNTPEPEAQQRSHRQQDPAQRSEKAAILQVQNKSSDSLPLSSHRDRVASTSLPKLVAKHSKKSLDTKDELLKAGILPEFLEHLDISELPPLAGSSSSQQNHSIKKTDPVVSTQLKPARTGTAILDKVAIFLTTPIELSMPIKFAKRRPDVPS